MLLRIARESFSFDSMQMWCIELIAESDIAAGFSKEANISNDKDIAINKKFFEMIFNTDKNIQNKWKQIEKKRYKKINENKLFLNWKRYIFRNILVKISLKNLFFMFDSFIIFWNT